MQNGQKPVVKVFLGEGERFPIVTQNGQKKYNGVVRDGQADIDFGGHGYQTDAVYGRDYTVDDNCIGLKFMVNVNSKDETYPTSIAEVHIGFNLDEAVNTLDRLGRQYGQVWVGGGDLSLCQQVYDTYKERVSGQVKYTQLSPEEIYGMRDKCERDRFKNDPMLILGEDSHLYGQETDWGRGLSDPIAEDEDEDDAPTPHTLSVVLHCPLCGGDCVAHKNRDGAYDYLAVFAGDKGSRDTEWDTEVVLVTCDNCEFEFFVREDL